MRLPGEILGESGGCGSADGQAMATDRPVIGQVLHRLERAGAEVLAAALARQLRSRFNCVFLCLDGVGQLGEELRDDGFEVIDIQRRPGIDLGAASRIRRAVRDHRIALLHAHQYTPFFYSALARNLRGFRGFRGQPPILFTEHGRHYPDSRKTRRVWANKFLLRGGDRVTAVSGFIRQMLADNEGIPARRIELIFNGIDPSLRKNVQDESARRCARQEMGVADDELLIMQVARFHPVKDHATAISAFARVLEKWPNARLALVGGGELRADIEQRARQAGVFERINFMGVRSDVDKLLPGADLFLLSSLSEGASVTLLEAMAAGLAITATEVGGNPELVEHGRTGLLSPRGDAAALAQHLCLLLSDPEARRRMGRAGREKLESQFTEARMHAAYIKLYEQMLGRPTVTS